MSDHRFLQEGFEAQLAHLIEECGEVLSAAGKTQRWGRDSVNPLLPLAEQETNEDWLKRELVDLKQAIGRLEHTLGVIPAPPTNHGYRLFWVQEESEVYAAKSAEEAKSFVEKLIGEAIPDDEVGEVLADKVGSDDDGQPMTLYQEFNNLEPLSEPVQVWSAYT